jgi:mannosyltransferase OCH1-like enzyme
MIPRLLHQTWKVAEPPQPYAHWRATWKRFNPELDYRFWDDQSCREFVQREFPNYLEVYDRLPFDIQRADFFRYLVIYRFGGLYADIDMECLRPVTDFFKHEGALFSIESQVTEKRRRELGYRHPYQIANCIFAAVPRHPFLGLVIGWVVTRALSRRTQTEEDVLDITGPVMLTRLFYDHAPAEVQVLNQIFWMAPRRYPNWFPINRNMHARHHCYGSWRWIRTPRSLRRRWIERDIMPPMFPRTLLHEGLTE